MAEFDILGALEATATRSEDRCVLQRWIDDIPEDAAGKATLVAAMVGSNKTGPEYRTLTQAAKIARRLQLKVSENSIGHHRAQRCRCFD